MYIQSPKPPEMPFTVPKGYSGNAFSPLPRVPPMEAMAPPPKEPAAARPPDPPPDPPSDPPPPPPPTDSPDPTGEVAAFAPLHEDKRRDSGIFSKIPFLSSLLPPPRKKRGDKEILPEWAVIGIVLFLLLDSPDNDLLPFLLLLLLWD